MEILSYEPYHIGIKISPALPMDILRSKLLPKLRETDFGVNAEDVLPSNVKMENEVLASKGKTKFEINYALTALNTVGVNPIDTTDSFEVLLSLLKKLGYEMKGVASSIDVLTNVTVKTDIDPTKLINDSVKCDLTPWRELNENTNVNGLKIDLIDEKFGRESLRMLVGPSSLSPTSQLVFSIRYLHIESEPIIAFGKTLENKIMKFAQSLGE